MDVSGTAEYGLNNLFSINDIGSNHKFKNPLTSECIGNRSYLLELMSLMALT